MTETEKRIILFANQMGYTPIRKQARAIWDEWNVITAAMRAREGKGAAESDEGYQRSMREAVEKVMGPPKGKTTIARPAEPADGNWR